MLKLTTATFDREVLESKEPVLVEFYTSWCPGCKAIAPVLEKVAGAVAGKAKVAQVNVEEELEIGERYGIMAVPTLMLFRDGKVVADTSTATHGAVLQRTVDLAA
jgi:thioredoxin 1